MQLEEFDFKGFYLLQYHESLKMLILIGALECGRFWKIEVFLLKSPMVILLPLKHKRQRNNLTQG